MRLTGGVILNELLRIGWHVVTWDAVQLARPVVFQRPEHTPEQAISIHILYVSISRCRSRPASSSVRSHALVYCSLYVIM